MVSLRAMECNRSSDSGVLPAAAERVFLPCLPFNRRADSNSKDLHLPAELVFSILSSLTKKTIHSTPIGTKDQRAPRGASLKVARPFGRSNALLPQPGRGRPAPGGPPGSVGGPVMGDPACLPDRGPAPRFGPGPDAGGGETWGSGSASPAAGAPAPRSGGASFASPLASAAGALGGALGALLPSPSSRRLLRPVVFVEADASLSPEELLFRRW